MASKHAPSSRKRAASSGQRPDPAKKRDSKTIRLSPRPTKDQSRARTRTAFSRNAPPQHKLQVYVFGEGSAGELGLGPRNATEVKSPRVNTKLTGVVSIATGGMHAVALTSTNKILTWGINDHATLGRETVWDGGLRDADAEDSDAESDELLNPKESTPTEVQAHHFPPGTEFAQIAAGDSTTFVLTTNGRVYGWGTFRDHNGVFGFTLDSNTGEVVQIQREPLLVPGLKNITQISAGSDFALALDADGHVFAWGCGQQNELGHRLIERRRLRALLPTPIGLPKTTRIVSIHAAANHAFAIDSDGQTWAWGSNNFGQTGFELGAGRGEATVCPPQKVPCLKGIKMKIAGGGLHHSIGVTQSGDCLVWGRMDGFQTGLDFSKLPLNDPSTVIVDSRGTPRILLSPTALPIPPCVHIAAGSDHNFAVTAEGKTYSWGFNATYQCGQGTDEDIEVARLMNGKQIRDEKIIWAGAGGQYGMLASWLKEN